jgi:hypothetical protein
MRSIALALLLVACGGAPAHPVAASTHYRVGDYVVYRYAGRMIGRDPMLLMEEIVAQDGDRLVIEVTLSRGHDTVRAWRQTVIDTEENRSGNRVEALCEIRDGVCAPLANEGNADLLRLYDGLVLTPDAPATDVAETDEDTDVGGTSMHCHVRRGHVTREGQPLTSESIECPTFLWTHAGASFDQPDKVHVLSVTVESFGPPR